MELSEESLYRHRAEWNDLEAIPQDDGPNPVVPIKYSEEFEDAMGYFRAVIAKEEKSERVLELTSRVIELNAGNYSVWHYRRLVLESLGISLYQEIEFLNSVVLDNPKNYQMWYHRLWVTEKLGPAVRDSELEFVEEMLKMDAKNYHAWTYRQWILRSFGGWENEIQFVNRLLKDDVWNNSAWNQRYFVMQHWPSPDALRTEREHEIQFCQEAILAAPSNESPWSYLRGLYSGNWSEMVAEGAVMALCRTVFALDPSCVPALRLFLELVSRGAPLESSDLSLLHLGDGASRFGVCQAVCQTLGDELDKMRRQYWQYRLRIIESGMKAI